MELEWMTCGTRWPSLPVPILETSLKPGRKAGRSAHLPSCCRSHQWCRLGVQGRTPELLWPRRETKPSDGQRCASGRWPVRLGAWRCWCVAGRQLTGHQLGKRHSGQHGLGLSPSPMGLQEDGSLSIYANLGRRTQPLYRATGWLWPESFGTNHLFSFTRTCSFCPGHYK